MSVVLMTGFEPFGGEAVNASWEAVRQLEGVRIGGVTIRTALLPTVFGDADEHLLETTRKLKPRALIMVGQAAGRDAISLERRAVNRAHAKGPDNAGRQPRDERLRAEAPEHYASSLPIPAIARGIRGAGIAVRSSLSAGTFVCNAVFFAACHHREMHAPDLRVGFIHIPLMPGQAKKQLPSMAVEDVVAALRLATAATAIALGAGGRRRALAEA